MFQNDEVAAEGRRNASKDFLQAEQYQFPYHYLPRISGFPQFSRNWSYSGSYLAALRIFCDWLVPFSQRMGGLSSHLDIGCGDGGFLNGALQNKGLREVKFTGIDFDARAIQWATSFSVGKVDFIHGDIARLPAAYFDSASLVEVYEHIPPAECASFLEEVAGRLKTGAELFVTVPSIVKPVSAKHYRHFDFETLEFEFRKNFMVKEVFGFERKSFLTKLLHRLFVSNRWYFEAAWTNELVVRTLQQKYSELKGCGRVGLIATKL